MSRHAQSEVVCCSAILKWRFCAGAVVKWRQILGPTDSELARRVAPESIRAAFGTDKTHNACHGSDSFESAEQECDFFFAAKVFFKLPQPTSPVSAEGFRL